MTELPLFPLHSVLCPGIALPLHIFEERYRLMVARCIERSAPFGVVLIRTGREVGELDGHVADVGTTAAIRQAGRYPDGRLDIVTVGERRFRIERVDMSREPYLVGQVALLDEPIGGEAPRTDQLARHLGQRFLHYLELLQPIGAVPGDALDAQPLDAISMGDDGFLNPLGEAGEEPEAPDDLNDRQRAQRLLASARRLVQASDANAVSYLLTGLVQVELAVRQELLEAPDTLARLEKLESLLSREIQLIGRNLRPLAVDPRTIDLRRN
jgi:Lon protease-like protein